MMTFISIALIIVGILLMQNYHYDFLSSQFETKSLDELVLQYQAHLKEYEEMKKKVDALVLKNGFKL
jgi:hypothetical protein